MAWPNAFNQMLLLLHYVLIPLHLLACNLVQLCRIGIFHTVTKPVLYTPAITKRGIRDPALLLSPASISNDTVKQCRSKAIDMCFLLLRDRDR
jgi:hypothetical protein